MDPAAGPPTGALDLHAELPDRGVDLTLSLAAGTVTAVLGANGAGKSTLLDLVAGLVRPAAGRIALDGRALVDTADGTWVPPHRRGTVLLAQTALLFPHLSALENVAFGPRAQGVSRSVARAQAVRWLEAVGAADLADRRPARLSGGQAQRIALARALASAPALLLLDEPMAALDVAVAPVLRQLLRTVLRDSARTALLVTHDLLDALALADRVVVLADGRVVEDGPAREVLARPRSEFAARIAGVNLVSGTAAPDGLLVGGLLVGGQMLQGHRTVHGTLDPACVAGAGAVALFRPHAVAIHLVPPGGSPRNDLPVTVTELEARGATVRVHASLSGPAPVTLTADVTAAAVADLDLVPGAAVHFTVKATEVDIFPAAG